MTQCHSRLFYYQQRPLSSPHNGFPKGNPWEIAINLAHPTNLGNYAYNLVTLKRKNLISDTPLKDALNAFIFALNDSAKAFIE